MVRATWIADETVVYRYPDGRRVRGRIALGRPTPSDRDWACRISLDGYMSGPRGRPWKIFGASSLQALLLAAQFLGYMLYTFTSRGGRVLEANGRSEMPLDASFGPLLCDPTEDERRIKRRPKTRRALRPKPKRA